MTLLHEICGLPLPPIKNPGCAYANKYGFNIKHDGIQYLVSAHCNGSDSSEVVDLFITCSVLNH